MAAKHSRRDFLRWTSQGAFAALASVALGDVTSYATEYAETSLKLPKWDADGFRVGLLADLHVITPEATVRATKAVQWVVEQKPDAIVFAGDFVSKSNGYVLDYIRQSLKPVREAKCPVLGVMGNHDYWAHSPESVFRTVQASGVRLLRNECVDVHGVGIVGLDDALMGRHRPDMLMDERLPKSLISVLHEPDYVDEMPGRASLQLSGHSHGGQICLPGGIALHTPRGARKYKAGFFEETTVPLYVSRGVGTMGPDLRLFCRPEATILTLRSA